MISGLYRGRVDSHARRDEEHRNEQPEGQTGQLRLQLLVTTSGSAGCSTKPTANAPSTMSKSNRMATVDSGTSRSTVSRTVVWPVAPNRPGSGPQPVGVAA
jgi:hypothetical protein